MVSHMKGGKIFQRVKLNRKVLLVLDLSMTLSLFDPWSWFPAVLLILFGLGKGQAFDMPTSDCVEIGKTHCLRTILLNKVVIEIILYFLQVHGKRSITSEQSTR